MGQWCLVAAAPHPHLVLACGSSSQRQRLRGEACGPASCPVPGTWDGTGVPSSVHHAPPRLFLLPPRLLLGGPAAEPLLQDTSPYAHTPERLESAAVLEMVRDWPMLLRPGPSHPGRRVCAQEAIGARMHSPGPPHPCEHTCACLLLCPYVPAGMGWARPK